MHQSLLLNVSAVQLGTTLDRKLECGPMLNVMAALPNIGGALCSTPQSLAHAHIYAIAYSERSRSLKINNIIQMMHGCKWNIQICCPEVDMLSRGRSPSDDISTEGQHI